ncbi:hypothetical protein BO82DRAFT_398456 [Aspergillus uvarum CBS 121591]|uniref:Uncharacterized protein n=1 Tax=Aspergillus uvarum CBS 121591 TaxID=1448315 RepID=A0A319E379_9EURO|nr:hypothetical protein BO82DRAFT_398456 [Aspergillus uvarum CBS 121591]PYH85582.1 hypothetical protein BO82DRAFT_398456 [Aspergillus uvarum CBS 121591]
MLLVSFGTHQKWFYRAVIVPPIAEEDTSAAAATAASVPAPAAPTAPATVLPLRVATYTRGGRIQQLTMTNIVAAPAASLS